MKTISTRPLTGLLGEVRRQNNFVVHIEGITTDGNNLDLIVTQAFLPKVSVQVLEFRQGNDSKKLAGVASWQGGELRVHDTLSRAELDALNEWFKQTYDSKTGQIGMSQDYKKQGYITEYAADGRYSRRWNLEGMWISDRDLGQLMSSSAELKELSFTIQIDPSDIEPEYYDSVDTAWNE